MINNVTLLGRLGADPEIRHTANNNAVANLSLATSENYKDKNGEWQKKTEWHRVIVWGKIAEACGNILKKGSMIFVNGKMQTRSWEDQSGKKNYTTEVIAKEIKFLDPKKDQNSNNNQQNNNYAPTPNEEPSFASDDDIPF